jgi:hypothetical protein
VLSSSPLENFRKFSTKTEEISTPAKINLCFPPLRGKTSGNSPLKQRRSQRQQKLICALLFTAGKLQEILH